MNRFIKQLLLFSAFPLGVLAIVFVVLDNLNKDVFEQYRVKPSVHTLLIGDSHVQYALNDTLLPYVINLAKASESYLFSYYKLEMLLRKNPSIKTVYLGLGYHSISSYYDDFFYGKYSVNIAPRYFSMLPRAEQWKLVRNNMNEPTVFLRSVMEMNWDNIHAKSRDYSFLGYFKNEFTKSAVFPYSVNKRIKFQFYKQKKVCGFSETNLYYLIKIIDLCKINGVQLVAINTPIHNQYRDKIPKKFKDKYNTLVKQYHLKLIDFPHLNLQDSCFIPDGDHVSLQGAVLTSMEFKKLR